MKVTDFLFDLCFMSVLLFIGKIMRAKIKFLQRLYVPAALIAGLLGLFCGKFFLNIIPFSSEISSYSGILIVVLFATMFLGNKKKSSFKTMLQEVGDTFLVNGATEIVQFGFFILVGVVLLPLIFSGINKNFGLLLPAGFVGGHGTAAAIGGFFMENGWDDATSIAQTFATIGLVGGILLGVLYINIGARKGYTKIIKSVNELPEDMLTGLVPEDKRTDVGANTVYSLSIDSLSWHLALVLVSVGMAYLINKGLKIILPQVSFPVYAIALICGVLLNFILKLLKFDDYVDKKIINHIGSSATDYLVAFGVASINIKIVIQYWVPIVVLAILGFVFVSLILFVISPRFFHNYWFERGIYIFGLSTGVMATGVILLRVTDPEFKSGVLEDFGFAWIFLSIMDMLLVSFSPLLLQNGYGLIYGLALVLLAVLLLVLCKIFYKNKAMSV